MVSTAPRAVLARRLVGAARPAGRSRSVSGWRPDLPPGRVLTLPGRGEAYVRLMTGPDGARPVVLLHGISLSSDLNFQAVMGPLAERHPVVSMDHRGHGHGLPVTGRFDIEDCADDVVAVLDALGIERAILCGFSLGGPVSLHAALRHPERVAGLVLAATSLNYNTLPWTKPLSRGMPLLEQVVRLGFGASVSSRYYGLNRHADPTLDARWPWLRAELARCRPRDLLAMAGAVLRYDLRGRVGPLRGLPSALVLTGRDTICPPGRQRQLAQQIGADIVELDADHDVFVADPAAFTAAVLTAVGLVDAAGPTAGAH